MEVGEEFWVRVLLVNNTKEVKLKINSSFTISEPQAKMSQRMFKPSDSTMEVKISDGKIRIGKRTFSDNEMTIAPDTPHIFNLNGINYRGKLKIVINPDGNSFDAINLVPLEPYLAGVVGAEMPDYWESAALQAQAIAARTYCLYMKKRFGPNRAWDVTKTQANQVYLGVGAESPQIWQAVNTTSGEVLVCKHTDGKKDIFPAYYSSTCGGHTENSQNVFGGEALEPLKGKHCQYCQYVAKPSSFFWPMVQFQKEAVCEKLIERYPSLKKLGEIKDIVPVRQSDYHIKIGNQESAISRLTFIKLTGSTGKTDHIRAEDLRITIDPTGNKIKSTICKIESIDKKWAFLSGRGWGHGVGMCQCGAQGMARIEGKKVYEILYYYYPNSEIKYVY